VLSFLRVLKWKLIPIGIVHAELVQLSGYLLGCEVFYCLKVWPAAFLLSSIVKIPFHVVYLPFERAASELRQVPITLHPVDTSHITIIT
jgi:hypothetical protein